MEYQRRPDSAFPAPRRVFTAPQLQPPSSTTADGGLVETLYNHPSVKIVSFSAGPRPIFREGKGIAAPVEVEPGSLSWSSQLERTIAVGPFRIYRAPGSVAFLSCGSALQPILPKSQCWCVDEASSKYVLQIRRPQFWRIELPVADDGNIRLALGLREVLDKVLQFEKTECPFRRTFTVELPERPQTPVKKRPWTPVRRSFTSLPPTPVTPVDGTPTRTAQEETPKNLSEDTATVVMEKDAASPPETAKKTVPALDLSGVDLGTVPDGTSSEPEEAFMERADNTVVPRTVVAAVDALEQTIQREHRDVASDKLQTPTKPNGFQSSRSVTAPPQLSLFTAPAPQSPSGSAAALPEQVLERTESHSPTGSHDSFHSVKSWTTPITPLPPSPPLTAAGSPQVLYPQELIFVPKKMHHHDGSDLTITPNTPLTGNSSEAADIDHVEQNSPGTSVTDDAASSMINSLAAEDCIPSIASISRPDQPSSSAADATTVAETTSAATTRSTPGCSTSSTILTRRPYMRHRPTASSSISPSRGALTRLPSAADLFPSYRPSPSTAAHPKPSALSLVRRIPMAVIHKTVEILLSPPSHLVSLMLKVAARIAAGEWRGMVFGFGEEGERIPVAWDWSDEDDDGEGELGGWGADEDWEFAGRREHSEGVRLKMAGAFPESPEGEEDRQLGTEEQVERDESPSPSRRRSLFLDDGMDSEPERDDEEADNDAAAAADWTGSLSLD